MLLTCAEPHDSFSADSLMFDMEEDYGWAVAFPFVQKTTCSVRASFQAGFNLHVQDASWDSFPF